MNGAARIVEKAATQPSELRDYFAAMALVGLLAYQGEGGHQMDAQSAARQAYEYADAMMKEKSK